jgi:DNA gyrase subunit B
MKGTFTLPSRHCTASAIEISCLCYSDEEMERIVGKMGGKPNFLSRYKGLGEMNRTALGNHYEPGKPHLLQVDIEDAVEADQTFDMLMGSLVPPRRRFIQTHAKEVRNLDV